MPYELIPLGQLHPGQSANVGHLLGRPEEVHRLEELGLRQGATVQMVQSGSPCIVRLGGSKLCFRTNDALRVLVQPGTER